MPCIEGTALFCGILFYDSQKLDPFRRTHAEGSSAFGGSHVDFGSVFNVQEGHFKLHPSPFGLTLNHITKTLYAQSLKPFRFKLPNRTLGKGLCEHAIQNPAPKQYTAAGVVRVLKARKEFAY